jgi:hypothetical protein
VYHKWPIGGVAAGGVIAAGGGIFGTVGLIVAGATLVVAGLAVFSLMPRLRSR